MEQKLALEILKTGRNTMLTGMAGAGKTYTLNQYISYLKNKRIKYAVTASTGIAASHLNGVTIHAWSGIGVKDELSKKDLETIKSKKPILQEVAVLIIDEISMLHSRQLELVDQVLKYCRGSNEPFGGIQVVACGDFFQLPPVEKDKDSGSAKFCFMSRVWVEAGFHICYLTKQYRQQGDILSQILNQIRDNTVTEESLDMIVSTKNNDLGDQYTRLYTHNINVDAENERHLEKLPTKAYEYFASFSGSSYLCDLILRQSRIPEVFTYKVGALVMFTKNNDDLGYCNGTCGEIISVIEDKEYGHLPVVLTKSGEKIVAYPEEWSIGENDDVQATVKQLPLRLAWAITVHKSQGMTLDAAEIDLRNVFEQGQGYVALSRLRTLSGMRVLGINDMTTHISTLIRKVDKRFRELSDELQAESLGFKFDHEQKVFYSKVRKNNGIYTISSKNPRKYAGRKSANNSSKAKTNKELVTSSITSKLSLEDITNSGKLSYSTVVKHLIDSQKNDPSLNLEHLKPEPDILHLVSKAIRSYNELGKELPFIKNNSAFIVAHVGVASGQNLSESEIWQALLFLDNQGDLRI